MIKIIVDCFGGDKSPEAQIKGGLLALKNIPDVFVIFTGDEKIIKDVLAGEEYDRERIEIVHAPEVIGCDEKPTDVIRIKKESSLMKGIMMLRQDDSISGLVSTGSTGAIVTAATLLIGRLRGVIRPAFCPVLPTMNGGVVGICDSGANVDCKADMLEQFAIMGSEYMKSTFGIEKPRVGLLNIGAEAEKGDDLHKEAYKLLEANENINFCGNMEARELLKGNFDLVVCDGFSGNVLIKSTEGACLEMLKMLKKDIFSKTMYKIGALFMKKMFDKEKEFMNYQNYGGSVLLGTCKVIVKGHGSSNEVAVAKCIEQAYKMETGKMNERVEEITGRE